MNKPNLKYINFDKIVKIVDSGINEKTGNIWIEFKTTDDDNIRQKTQTGNKKRN